MIINLISVFFRVTPHVALDQGLLHVSLLWHQADVASWCNIDLAQKKYTPCWASCVIKSAWSFESCMLVSMCLLCSFSFACCWKSQTLVVIWAKNLAMQSPVVSLYAHITLDMYSWLCSPHDYAPLNMHLQKMCQCHILLIVHITLPITKRIETTTQTYHLGYMRQTLPETVESQNPF